MKLKCINWGLAALILCSTSLLILRQQKMNRLSSEIAALQQEVGQKASLEEENQQLLARAKTTSETTRMEQEELIRLRAQSLKLKQAEQENARLKQELQRLASQSKQGIPSTSPPEQPQVLPSSESRPPALDVAASVRDLGTVELSERMPTRLDLGNGRECLVSTSLLANGQLQLVFSSESKTEGGIAIKTEQTAIAAPGIAMATKMNDVEFIFIPSLKSK